MRALVTGANGFVGKYLTQRLTAGQYEVFGCDINVIENNGLFVVDLLDESSINAFIKWTRPDYIFHLAGLSSVSNSWTNPSLTFEVNMKGALHLLNAVRSHAKGARTLLVGSSEEYGLIKPESLPVNEATPIAPVNPYALSKYAVERLGFMYCQAYGLDIVFVRAFNHTGAGQPRGFVIPDFCANIAAIEKGSASELYTGNLDAVRDFSDVRDIIEGYVLLMQKGQKGEVYNIGCGKGYRIGDILDRLLALSTLRIPIKTDLLKLRPSDIPVIICDNSKIRRGVGYTPNYSIEDTLASVLEYWRKQ